MHREGINILDVVDGLYAGAWNHELWLGALTRLADLVDGEGTIVFSMNPSNGDIGRHDVVRADLSVLQDYQNRWIAADPRLEAAMTKPVGVSQTEQTLLRAEELRSSAFFHEFLLKNDMPFFIAAWLRKDRLSSATISIQRSRERGPFQQAQRSALDRVIPHLTRALEIKDHVQSLELRAQHWLDAAEASPAGIVLLDRDLRILQASRAAQNLLRDASVIRCEGGHLRLTSPIDERRFRDYLADGSGARPNRAAVLSCRRAGRSPLFLTVAPVSQADEFWLRPAPAWILSIRDPESLRIDVAALAHAFNLTPAEARVAKLLAEGLTPARIAEAVGSSTHTVRTHVRALYDKTATNSHAAFMRIAVTFSGLAGDQSAQ